MDLDAQLDDFFGALNSLPAAEPVAEPPVEESKPAPAPSHKSAPHPNQRYAPNQIHLYDEPTDDAPLASIIASAPVLHKKKRKNAEKTSDSKKSRRTGDSAEVSATTPSEVPPWQTAAALAVYDVIPGDILAVQALEKKKEIKASQVKSEKEKKKDPNKYLRTAAGEVWEDTTLCEWPEGDFRIFCGDLGNEVNDNSLGKLFQGYASFNKAKVIRDKKTQKTKGFGFVSFGDPYDCANALREVNGKYCGNRPIKLRRSNWKGRAIANAPHMKPKVKKRGGKKRHLF